MGNTSYCLQASPDVARGQRGIFKQVFSVHVCCPPSAHAPQNMNERLPGPATSKINKPYLAHTSGFTVRHTDRWPLKDLGVPYSPSPPDAKISPFGEKRTTFTALVWRARLDKNSTIAFPSGPFSTFQTCGHQNTHLEQYGVSPSAH